ncbi:hypothetical protein ABVK25_000600 [Lepraria finkii]|uniref:Uncharacterized protein n=1 Tax=Lepraria finkii TaxID=1340010 RepID=A0ABR4BNC5_9LECA
MTMNYSPSAAFSLTEALESEVLSLVRIHIAAFALENSSRLMFKDNASRERKLQEMLQAQISDPNYAVIKAVDKDTDEIFGWLGVVGLDTQSHKGKVTQQTLTKSESRR